MLATQGVLVLEEEHLGKVIQRAAYVLGGKHVGEGDQLEVTAPSNVDHYLLVICPSRIIIDGFLLIQHAFHHAPAVKVLDISIGCVPIIII